MSGSIRKRLAAMIAIVGAVAGLVLIPTAASASQSSVLGCQPASATLRYLYYKSDGSLGVWTKNCSGYHDLNSRGYRLEAGGWSGYIHFNNNTNKRFCDWQIVDLTSYPRVIAIEMRATKTAGCP